MGSSTLILIAINGVLAYSFYAVLIAGQLSLAQMGCAAIAAFVAARWAPDDWVLWFVPPLVVAIVMGMAVGALAALLIGLPVMRLRGVFLAIATLGFAEMARITLNNMSWTNGALGMSVTKLVNLPIAVIVLAVVAYWFARQRHSRLGRAFAAVREDELAALAMGIDVARHRLVSYVTAGSLAGLYGVLYAYFTRFIEPNNFNFPAAVDGLVKAVVGGTSAFIGPVLGAAFFELIPDVQRWIGLEAGWIRPFFAGLLLLLVIIFLPGGLAGLLRGRTRLVRPVAASALGTSAPFDDPADDGAVVDGATIDGTTGDGTTGDSAGMAGDGVVDHGVVDHGVVDGAPGAGGSLGPPEPAPGGGIVEVLVELRGFSKDYGGVHAVKQVDLDVRGGEVLGLIGPNGAGKTTLVNMISGFVPPSSGTGRVLGLTLDGRARADRIARVGLSRTFQHSKLFPRLSAFENVLVGAHSVTRSTFLRRLLWLPSAWRDERAADAIAWRQLERVGLADRASAQANELAYGDQRRLEIARALASDPRLLILDEPAAGMNHVEAAAIGRLITALAAEGITILLIEHNVRMVMQTCTRIVVLSFGEVIATGTPAEIAADPVVIEAYLGSSGDEAA